MESFIVYKLNETSYKQDINMLPLYGPYAAALSFIVGYSFKAEKGNLTIYRGMSLPSDVIQSYTPGHKLTINGFKSGSLNYDEALGFALDGYYKNKETTPVLLVIEYKKSQNIF